ncbi:MAG: NAD(P)-dependent oxidoreductase [Parachlamydia sp.]|nr:NAD(P)-dependent oxidoreductase [Parachlamydia sp.]
MKILFTGGSSFSGLWFAREMALAGHAVTCCFRSTHYEGLRKERVDQLLPLCDPHFDCSFGSPRFMQIITSNRWDLFCHHAADVTDYKSPDFNFAAALTSNTQNLKNILQVLQEQGCNRILLTGSVFEQNEGAGSDNLRAVSPYGLSKGLTADVFHYFCTTLSMKLGKFVIPNPFGPYEEPRYTAYLMKTWRQGHTARVNTPDYVRDNIPISLLAKAYRSFAETLTQDPGFVKLNPSCYAETQGAFTSRFSREMQSRLSFPCAFELQQQVDFPEPKVRINTDPLPHAKLGWEDEKAWDELAHYYQSISR